MNKEVRSKIYTVIVVIAAISVALIAFQMWPLATGFTPIWKLAFLTVLVVVAGRFPIELSKVAEASLRVVPFYIAVLLVHPIEAIAIAAVGTLISEKLIGARPIEQVFNTGVDALTVGAAGIVFYSLKTPAAPLALTAAQMMPIAATGLTILGVNAVLNDTLALLRKGTSYFEQWGKTYIFETIQEAGFLAIGLIAAILMTLAWWGVAIVAVPAVLTFWGFRQIITDAAEKTRMAAELEKNLEELKGLQAHLINSAKMASVGSLATGIAHEINNPVFAISGRADLLIKGADKHLASEKASEYVRNIKEMAGRISKITAHLMEYSQPSEERKDVVLSEVVDGAVVLMGKKGKSLRIIREYEDAPIVNVVPSRLQQVFVNLLANSADAIADWGSVTIGCKIEGEKAVAYVKDDGTGMTDEVKARLFEPFVSSKEVDNRVGMGLGLYTCHQIVDAHGGEIIVNSELGSGTTVAVRLPLAGVSPWQAEVVPSEVDLPMAVGMND
ncbi:MAG: HAMP domain-containing histidine kinase [Chloroflexi bacterium]|nr:HAMP domain-containing histidine kinase [Chloroflexota bacterium]